MPFVKVAPAAGLEADSVTEVLVGDTPYAICNVGGKITALSGICPHRGGPLGQGAINGSERGLPMACVGVELRHRRKRHGPREKGRHLRSEDRRWRHFSESSRLIQGA